MIVALIVVSGCLMVAIATGGYFLWQLQKKLKKYDEAFEQQRFLVGKNREGIGANKEGIASNKRQIGANADGIKENAKAIAELRSAIKSAEGLEAKILGQMYIHEANLIMSEGLWCLENKGEKKYFRPGLLQRVESAKRGERSDFSYDMASKAVTCTVSGPEGVRSEIVYSLAGAPKSGKIFRDNKVVRTFKYNDLGQVV